MKIHGLSSGVFRHNADGKYRDVSAVVGMADVSSLYSHGCTVTDFDSDGFQDVVVCGFGALQLWHNLGDGTFAEAGCHDSCSPHVEPQRQRPMALRQNKAISTAYDKTHV